MVFMTVFQLAISYATVYLTAQTTFGSYNVKMLATDGSIKTIYINAVMRNDA